MACFFAEEMIMADGKFFKEQEKENALKETAENTRLLDDMLERILEFSVDFNFSSFEKKGVFRDMKPEETVYSRGKAEAVRECSEKGACMLGEDYYRDPLARAALEMSFVQYMKMPDEVILSGKPEDKAAKRKMGEIFHETMTENPALEKDLRNQHEAAARNIRESMEISNTSPFAGYIRETLNAYSGRQRIFRDGIARKLSESGLPADLAESMALSGKEEMGTRGKISQETGEKYAEKLIADANGDMYTLIRNVVQKLERRIPGIYANVSGGERIITADKAMDCMDCASITQSIRQLAERYPKPVFETFRNAENRQNYRNIGRAYRAARENGAYDELFAAADRDEEKLLLKQTDAAAEIAARQPEQKKDTVCLEYSKFEGLEKADPMKLREHYQTLGFTEEELIDTEITYNLAFGNNFSGKTAEALAERGKSEFDCIFINGKPVSEIYAEKKREKNEPADIRNPEEEDVLAMRAMVVSAGLYGANTISCTIPVQDRNGRLHFPQPQEVQRTVSREHPIDPPREGLWHWIRHLGKESWQDKFNRAAEHNDEMLKKCAAFAEAMNEKETAAAGDQDKKKGAEEKENQTGGRIRTSLRDIQKEEKKAENTKTKEQHGQEQDSPETEVRKAEKKKKQKNLPRPEKEERQRRSGMNSGAPLPLLAGCSQTAYV